MNINHILTALLLMAIPVTIANATPLQLAKGGNPTATIVVEKTADEEILQSARELQFYIKEISGVELPLKEDGIPASGTNLNIGKTATAQDSDIPGKGFGLEAFSIKLREGNLYLRGQQALPTAFAVYTFIEEQLGVKWFAPGDDWTYIPKSTFPGDLLIDIDDHIVDPDFSPRIWSGHDYGPEWKTWNLRNKTLQSKVISKRNFQNNIFRVFPPSKYGKTHPEFYALVNGKRSIPANDWSRYMTPCLGNTQAQQITIDFIRNYFDNNPNQDSFSLGFDDVSHMCECPLCRAMDANPDDHERKAFSNRYYTYVNIIAHQVKKTHPDKFIGTLIYNIVRDLPANVPVMEDNVFGYLADGSAGQWYQSGRKNEWMNTTTEWSKRMKHLSRYDYIGMGTLTPKFYPHWIDEAMKFDKSLGFNAAYNEVYTFLPQTAPMIWALSKLQWNTDQNIDDLLDVFYEKMFGKAAPSVKKYFSLMETSWQEERPKRSGWVWRNMENQALSISPEAAAQGENLLMQALGETNSPLEKKRIDIVLSGLRYGKFLVDEYDLVQRINALPLGNKDDAARLENLIVKMGKMVGERETLWKAAPKRDDLLGANLRGFHQGGRSFFRDATPIELPAVRSIVQLIEWNQKNDATNKETNRKIIEAFPESEVRAAVESWIYLQSNSLKSRLRNGNFSDTSKNTLPPEASDWVTQGVPKNWNLWSRYSAGSLKYTAGRESGNAVVLRSYTDTNNIQGTVINLLQNSPAKAGEKFVAIAWVKLHKAEDAENVSLRIRTRKGSGGGGDVGVGSQIASAATTDWQPLIASVTFPEGATFMTIVLSVADGEATFDDVALYKLP